MTIAPSAIDVATAIEVPAPPVAVAAAGGVVPEVPAPTLCNNMTVAMSKARSPTLHPK